MARELNPFERTQFLDVLRGIKYVIDTHLYSLWVQTGNPISGKYVKTLNLADIPAGGIVIVDVFDVANGWPQLRIVNKLNTGTVSYIWMEFVTTDKPDLFTINGAFISGYTQIKVISYSQTIELCKIVTSV